ncbi:MAG: twin-arginine translocase subunit TatC, partial [Pseudomonadota bacterium]
MSDINDSDINEVDASKMPLMAHLVELRQRLIYALLGVAVAFVFCFVVSAEIFNFLMGPYIAALDGVSGRMIFTGLQDGFMVKIRIGLFGAVCLAFPIIATQIWKFVAPGLYRHEKNAFAPFLIATPVLFIIGAALAYYIIMPLAWKFLLSQGIDLGSNILPVEQEPAVDKYLGLVMKMVLAFGISFELPV